MKLRPVVPSQLDEGLRQSPNMEVEVDAMPGGFVCSAALKRSLGTTEVRAAAKGERRLGKLFSKEQRASSPSMRPMGVDSTS